MHVLFFIINYNKLNIKPSIKLKGKSPTHEFCFLINETQTGIQKSGNHLIIRKTKVN